MLTIKDLNELNLYGSVKYITKSYTLDKYKIIENKIYECKEIANSEVWGQKHPSISAYEEYEAMKDMDGFIYVSIEPSTFRPGEICAYYSSLSDLNTDEYVEFRIEEEDIVDLI